MHTAIMVLIGFVITEIILVTVDAIKWHNYKNKHKR